MFLADTTPADQTTVYFAERRPAADRSRASGRSQLELENGTRHTTYAAQPEEYDGDSFDRLVLNLDAETVFPRTQLLKGDNEMTIAELRADVAGARSRQNLPYPASSSRSSRSSRFRSRVSCWR